MLSEHTDDTRTSNACQGLNFQRRDMKSSDIVSDITTIKILIFKCQYFQYQPVRSP